MVLRLDKRAAETRTHAQHVEEIRRDLGPRNQLGTAVSREAHGGIAIRADAFERVRALAPFHELAEIDRQRFSVAELRRRNREGDQALRIGIIERAQQHSAHQREDRGIGADADRQAEHCHRGEAAVLPKRSQRIFHVRRLLATRVRKLLSRLRAKVTSEADHFPPEPERHSDHGRQRIPRRGVNPRHGGRSRASPAIRSSSASRSNRGWSDCRG